MHSAIFALKRAYQATQKTIDYGLSAYGLSAAQLDVLILLSQGAREQRAIQTALGVTSATTAKLLTSMDKNGFIKRIKSKKDSRVKQVSLSKKGMDLLARLKQEQNDLLTERFFTEFSAAEAALLTELLTRVAVNMGDTSSNFFS